MKMEPIEWQLYSQHKQTLEIRKAFKNWKPMTQKESETCLRKMMGDQPKLRFFIAPITSMES
jgi:hypothetical protein